MDDKNFTRRNLLKGGVLLLTGPLWPHISFAQSSSKSALPIGSPAPASRYAWPRHEPLQANLQHALFVRNLGKRVERSLVIDDMESDRGWQASAVVQLSYTTERAKTGRRSLRFTTEQRNEKYILKSRSPNGSFTGQAPLFDFLPFAASARLKLSPPQDWTDFNRISVWCYLHPTGNPVSSICLQFVCEGADAGPYDPVAVNYFADLKDGEWNLLAWEIPEFRRDRITEISFFQPVFGLPFRDLPSLLTYDFDQLRVERVATEQVDGWQIAPSKMAYSHMGYASDGRKLAFTSDRDASHFELTEAETGRMVTRVPTRNVRTARGSYAICDFSSFSRRGSYRIRTGSSISEPFAISSDPWRPLVEATLNAFYGLRCGFAVPGAHDACHCDVVVRHNGESRIVGGGWHDAANLSQDPNNTNVSICALLDLAEALAPHDPPLGARALEEARWGLEWVQRMRFGPGVRYLMGSYSYFTDGVLNSTDDVVHENFDSNILKSRAAEPAGAAGAHAPGSTDAKPNPFLRALANYEIVGSNTFKNLTAALAEVRGAQALRATDSKLADELLKAAEEDFATVLRDRPEPPVEKTSTPNWSTVPWQNEAGYMALTAVELYRATGKTSYAETAARAARWVLDLQEFRFIDNSPVTGYFYEDAGRTRIMHEFQRTSGAQNSFEEGALLAYGALCDTLPDHPDWIRWYEGLLAFSEFFCRRGSEASAPFDIVPAAVWRESDLDAPTPSDRMGQVLAEHAPALFPTPPTPQLNRRQEGELYQAGTYLAPGQRLRIFPLWVDHIRHGATAVQLTKTIGLATAAQCRRNPDLVDLASRQVEWLVGTNPFSRSLVYGVGYDWWQNFTVSLPNLVGGLSVGMNSYHDDSPAWGNNAVFPYKEIWVLSSCRLAAVLARLPAKVQVEGSAPGGATLEHLGSGQITKVEPGAFRLNLTPGTYAVKYGEFHKQITFVAGRRYNLDFDAAKSLDLQLKAQPAAGEALTLKVDVRGSGKWEIELRSSNAELPSKSLTVDLGTRGTKTIDLPLLVPKRDRTWIIVAVPDGRLSEAVELFGTPTPLRDLSHSQKETKKFVSSTGDARP